ncbi:hypothetical protein BCh11DRAFT_02537 [Burkholderia sp. Ch1-1]|uniref:DUF488 domain-containing protein n=1 Tax=Paraburkholderia dioscoreae TaxID=2604047 RepID=A0A5Q4ZRK2_9BURK|nr:MULTISPECIES: DUF488 domain-containing protein [Paraburkholderia]EIF34731.1 hypothetical protein BCh11DRAFT_02537 [Burkholderia sp. Ch1-1]MDR8395609.1 DUF488 domain-containing protein [Paraburkholderia sp. USG1]VVD33890.1 conserved protein of unknown function [Paraburkholderia dioscoreae]
MKRENNAVPVATVGFTGKTAQEFFDLLKNAEVQTVLDIRLSNTSQLAGFAKKQDLPFFLDKLCGAAYREMPELAPEPDLFKRYKAKELTWDDFADAYVELIARRRVESSLDVDLFRSACLLCSEHLPHRCHRRLALEYLNSRWNSRLKITHLS